MKKSLKKSALLFTLTVGMAAFADGDDLTVPYGDDSEIFTVADDADVSGDSGMMGDYSGMNDDQSGNSYPLNDSDAPRYPGIPSDSGVTDDSGYQGEASEITYDSDNTPQAGADTENDGQGGDIMAGDAQEPLGDDAGMSDLSSPVSYQGAGDSSSDSSDDESGMDYQDPEFTEQ